MSANVAVDIIAGTYSLSATQERVLRESQGYVRGGTRVAKPTREVLKRLGLIEQGAQGHYTTAWGDAVGEELVAREAAKGEYLPEIFWRDGRGWMDSDRFMVSIDGPQAYELADDRTGHVQTFKTLVHLRQHVREVLAEDAREMEEARNRWAERFGGPVSVHQPTSEPEFLTLVRDHQPVVNGIKVLKVGRFSAGGNGTYACAQVIGQRDEVRDPERAYSVHRLIWNDDSTSWSLDLGEYDLSWNEAAQELHRRS